MGITPKPLPEPTKTTLHGTAVLLKAVGGDAACIFLRGLSGAGKSDLAFRLIEGGGQLICDDQVSFEKRHNRIYADNVESIRGLLEVRGIGLLRYPVAPASRVRLGVDRVQREAVPRLPDPETFDILGVALPRFRLCAFDLSAPLKINKALELLGKPGLLVT